jgi:hypothetical protein
MGGGKKESDSASSGPVRHATASDHQTAFRVHTEASNRLRQFAEHQENMGDPHAAANSHDLADAQEKLASKHKDKMQEIKRPAAGLHIKSAAKKLFDNTKGKKSMNHDTGSQIFKAEGAARGGKYVKRERKGSKWLYTYADTKSGDTDKAGAAIGKTTSGKPIYGASHSKSNDLVSENASKPVNASVVAANHPNFSAQDHRDAHQAHMQDANSKRQPNTPPSSAALRSLAVSHAHRDAAQMLQAGGEQSMAEHSAAQLRSKGVDESGHTVQQHFDAHAKHSQIANNLYSSSFMSGLTDEKREKLRTDSGKHQDLAHSHYLAGDALQNKLEDAGHSEYPSKSRVPSATDAKYDEIAKVYAAKDSHAAGVQADKDFPELDRDGHSKAAAQHMHAYNENGEDHPDARRNKAASVAHSMAAEFGSRKVHRESGAASLSGYGVAKPKTGSSKAIRGGKVGDKHMGNADHPRMLTPKHAQALADANPSYTAQDHRDAAFHHEDINNHVLSAAHHLAANLAHKAPKGKKSMNGHAELNKSNNPIADGVAALNRYSIITDPDNGIESFDGEQSPFDAMAAMLDDDEGYSKVESAPVELAFEEFGGEKVQEGAQSKPVGDADLEAKINTEGNSASAIPMLPVPYEVKPLNQAIVEMHSLMNPTPPRPATGFFTNAPSASAGMGYIKY